MRRLGTGAVLAALVGLGAAEPANAYYVWEDREFVDDLQFRGEVDGCGTSEDEWRQTIPGPAKEVEVKSPRDGQSLPMDGPKASWYHATADVDVTASNPYDHLVTITVKGGSRLCGPFELDWKTKSIEVRIEYKQHVYTTTPPVVSCTDSYASISRLRAQSTTCFYATSVARRYLGRLGNAMRRYIAPYTCTDTVIAEGRKVACTAPGTPSAPGTKYVWFRYERPVAPQRPG